MDRILLTLGALALGGSAAVIALMMAGRSTRGRYGARWRCWAWTLLCLRLAVPLSLVPRAVTWAPIQVDLPDPPAVIRPQDPPAGPAGSSAQVPVPPPGGTGGDQVQVPPGGSGPVTAPGAQAQGQEREISAVQILLGIWLLGAAAVLAWDLTSHLRFLAYLRRWSAPVTNGEAIAAFNSLGDQLSLHSRPRLLMCHGLKVPMLAGVLRPAILLPQGAVSGEELGLSLLHELTHYRRRDIWLKTLAMWVNALYWFDPLMWHMVRLVERDTELACDEDALRRLSPQDYAAYGQTILDAVARSQDKAV